MSNTNTGGPAFPVQSVYVEDQQTNSHGMTLRDYFAAKALPRVMQDGKTFYEIAEDAYEIADKMLKARQQ